MIETAAIMAAEAAINRIVSLDSATAYQVRSLGSIHILVNVTSPSIRLHLRIEEGHIYILRILGGEPDITLTGTAQQFIALAQSNKSNALMESGVTVAGRISLLEQLNQISQSFAPDLAKLLEQLTSPTLASAILKPAGLFKSWVEKGVTEQSRLAVEYLTLETKSVLTGPELAQFSADVRQLNRDIDRLEARINLRAQKS